MNRKFSLLVVDDDPDLQQAASLVLNENFRIQTAGSAEEALQKLSRTSFSVVLLDIGLPGQSGLEALQTIKNKFPQTQVIMLTASQDTSLAVQATRMGAYDFISKPYQNDHLLLTSQHAAEKYNALLERLELESELSKHRFDNIVGQSTSIKKVISIIQKVAQKNTTILITGETGTGKELVARAIHKQGNRKEKPFIAVNCGSIPGELLESELFGHEQGAFTSAVATKIGKFELANEGTLFLDEIGTMPLSMQTKILRALQEKEIERVGGTTSIKLDLKVVAATNENLKELVKAGKFRQDLYYRLNVIHIEVPALRQRLDDLELLCTAILEKLKKRLPHDFQYISPEALKILKAHRWPGNIRELEHVLERIVTLESGKTIEKIHLPLEIILGETNPKSPHFKTDLKKAIQDFEREMIDKALHHCQGNQTKAAKLLGINRTTLINKLALLNLNSYAPEYKS